MLTHTKPKTCQQCNTLFAPVRAMAVVCSPMCAIALGDKAKQKKAALALKEEKAKDRATRERLKKKGAWQAEAQTAVNTYVRARDAGEPCISCGTPWEKTFQAGHYRSVGSAKHLALDVRNINGQCIQCNFHKHSNAIDYRIGFIARYRVEFVEAIESDNAPRHNSIDDLKAIRKHYEQMTKQLKEQA
jgi:hypothetical protein